MAAHVFFLCLTQGVSRWVQGGLKALVGLPPLNAEVEVHDVIVSIIIIIVIVRVGDMGVNPLRVGLAAYLALPPEGVFESSRRPGAGSRQPGASSRLPVASSRRPGASSRRPGNPKMNQNSSEVEPEPGVRL